MLRPWNFAMPLVSYRDGGSEAHEVGLSSLRLALTCNNTRIHI